MTHIKRGGTLPVLVLGFLISRGAREESLEKRGGDKEKKKAGGQGGDTSRLTARKKLTNGVKKDALREGSKGTRGKNDMLEGGEQAVRRRRTLLSPKTAKKKGYGYLLKR